MMPQSHRCQAEVSSPEEEEARRRRQKKKKKKKKKKKHRQKTSIEEEVAIKLALDINGVASSASKKES